MPVNLMDLDPRSIITMASGAQKPEDAGNIDNNGAQTTETEEPAGTAEVETADADEAPAADDAADVDNNDGEDEGVEDNDSDDTDEPDDTDVEEEPVDDSPSYLVQDEEEGKEVFLKAVDPVTGEKSVYLDRESAQQGVQRQLEYIGELKRQVTEARDGDASESKRLLDELSIYRSSMTPEQAREALVVAKLPEGLRDVDPTTLTEDEDVKTYKGARIDAEIAVEREIREFNETQATNKVTATKAKEDAEKHVRSRVDDLKFFGLANPEDRFTILKKVNEKPEGSERTFREIADGIAEGFGPHAADQYLQGLAQDFVTQKTTDKKTERSTERKKVADTVKKVVQRPAKTAVKADKPRVIPDDPRSILEAANSLQTQRKK